MKLNLAPVRTAVTSVVKSKPARYITLAMALAVGTTCAISCNRQDNNMEVSMEHASKFLTAEELSAAQDKVADRLDYHERNRSSRSIKKNDSFVNYWDAIAIKGAAEQAYRQGVSDASNGYSKDNTFEEKVDDAFDASFVATADDVRALARQYISSGEDYNNAKEAEPNPKTKNGSSLKGSSYETVHFYNKLALNAVARDYYDYGYTNAVILGKINNLYNSSYVTNEDFENLAYDIVNILDKDGDGKLNERKDNYDERWGYADNLELNKSGETVNNIAYRLKQNYNLYKAGSDVYDGFKLEVPSGYEL